MHNLGDAFACSLISCNLNAAPSRIHRASTKYFSRHHITLLQETSFKNDPDIDTARATLAATYAPRVFINDRGRDASRPAIKHGGVGILLHPQTPGADSARNLEDLDIPNRYMVVAITWATAQVFVHCVYAPVNADENTPFYNSLPTTWPDDAVDIVGGDFNTTLDVETDTLSCSRQPSQATATWLSPLGVSDPWRIHNPETRVFSGPG